MSTYGNVFKCQYSPLKNLADFWFGQSKVFYSVDRGSQWVRFILCINKLVNKCGDFRLG